MVKRLNEAAQTSYRQEGEETNLTSEVSKQTIKNKIHQLEFPENEETPGKKKEVEYRYIDADKDHVSLPFREKKGDMRGGGDLQKKNHLITKLVYIYEGIEHESLKSKRHCLINPHYFCGVSTGELSNQISIVPNRLPIKFL